MTVSRHYVLAAGGTGGHMMPAYALAGELIQRGHRVALVTDLRGEAIPGRPDGLAVHVMPAGRLAGGPLGWLRAGRAILAGRTMSRSLYEVLRPSAVVGFGGYPAFPALSAASAMGLPCIIHEQNSVLGRVNRLLAGSAAAIVTAYRDVDRLANRHRAKVHLLGNPVRADILALREEPYPSADADGLLRVLVTGGSQGAKVLSEVVPPGLAALPLALRRRLQVVQQCRAEDIEQVRATYAEHAIPANLMTYITDMPQRLAVAHLVIGRAGASTIAELTVAGRPAILVPLPSATDDHQTTNVRDMVAAGGARSIPQSAFTAKELAKQVQKIAMTPETLANAAIGARRCGFPAALADLADLVESFGGAPLMDTIRPARTAPAARPIARPAMARDEGGAGA